MAERTAREGPERGTSTVKEVKATVVHATVVAISVVVGATVAFLTMISVPSEKNLDLVIDGDEVGRLVSDFVCWSVLTFLCVAPLTWTGVMFRRWFVTHKRRHTESDRRDRSVSLR